MRATYAVVALFEPIAIGATISRKAWPAHVTLASNFTVDLPSEHLVSIVRRAGVLVEPLVVHLAESAQFGPDHDVPVRLVYSAQISALHRSLADELEPLPGFAAEQPDYWRDGYRPHLTLSPLITAGEGDGRSARAVAVAQLVGSHARVVAAFEIPG